MHFVFVFVNDRRTRGRGVFSVPDTVVYRLWRGRCPFSPCHIIHNIVVCRVGGGKTENL